MGHAPAAPEVAYVAREPFLPFHDRHQRYAAVVAHRRAGKTLACIVDLLAHALMDKTGDGRYGFIAPFREQAKQAAWDYLKRYAAPFVRSTEDDFRESELAVRLSNGSRVRLYGADNPDSMRGLYFSGVCLDEYADMKRSMWEAVLRPALSDRRGWAVFIGTPKGHNAFWELYDRATRDPDWFTLTVRASESGLISAEELVAARKQMRDSLYEQEYECSWEAAIIGAVYAKDLAECAPRITSVPYDGAHLVHTAWDIGWGDSTSIWFWQAVGHEIRIIDYYEDRGAKITEYCAAIAAKRYTIGTCYLPHDATNGNLTGVTVQQQIEQAGFATLVLERTSLEDGIYAVRGLLPRTWFDAVKCDRGLERLRHYRWAYNQVMDEIKTTPVHDDASHAADALRYLAQAANASKTTHLMARMPPLAWPKGL